MEMKPTAFIVAAKEFFGFLPNQTLLEFKDEVSKLTPADRVEMADGMSKQLGKVVAN